MILKVDQVIGYLTIKKLYINDKNQKRALCSCKCGNTCDLRQNYLRGKRPTKSCGCYQKERASQVKRTHHKTKSVEYNTWCNMHTRCYNTKYDFYDNYGGRGIKVCEEWHIFENFYKDMGDRPGHQYSIERKDPNGNYCKDNCEWQLKSKQTHNTTKTIRLEYNGETKSLVEWAELHKLPYTLVYSRYWNGYRGKDLFKPKIDREIKYKDKLLTLEGWSKETGIAYRTLLSRYRKGIVPPELFAPIIRTAYNKYRRNKDTEAIEWNGETKPLREWAKSLNIKLPTLLWRFNRGIRPPELFMLSKEFRKINKDKLNG